MSETAKIKLLKNKDYFNKYFSGSVIDIGAGDDPIFKHALIFDKSNGDANHILDYIKIKFDTVYSSNLLEHLNNPLSSIKDFESLVNDNGYLIIVIPIYEYYEQSTWPSIFNIDHKFAFSFFEDDNNNKIHIITINNLINELKFSKLVSFEAVLENFNQSLIFKNYFGLNSKILRKLSRITFEINKRINNSFLKYLLLKIFTKLNIPFDQSSGNSLCSMILIFKKCIK